MTQPLIRAEGIGLNYNGRSILDQVSLQISPAEIVTLIGPNGAGKTSLVRVILGLVSASEGTISRRPDLRIGYMPQKLHIDKSLPLSVQRFMGLAKNDKSAIRNSLAMTEVEHLRNSPLQSLSGGELQRVMLARAILRQPNLLVLDEPVQGVDVSGQARLYGLISELRDQLHCGVLMVSHDLHLVMAATDTVICLNQHICCHGHPDKVVEHPAYLEMFGQPHSAAIALYTHHHDHSHDLHGDVQDQGPCNHA